MRKMKIQVNDIAELVERYNPFGFKDAKGRIMVFRTYDEAYFELMDRIYKAGPVMVDAVLFCVDNLGMSHIEATRFVALWAPVTGQKSSEFFFDWKAGGYYLEHPLEAFAKGMHTLSETKFNKDMFLSAFDRIKIKYNVKQTK